MRTHVRVNIPYLGEHRAQKMDIHSPEGEAPESGWPALVVIHGGGWYSGNRHEDRAIRIAHDLNAAGFLCAVIDYTLATVPQFHFMESMRQSFPRNLKDCKAAVRYLRQQAATYRIDPDRIGALGCSAGGHLAAMVASTGPEAGFEPDEGDPSVPTSVRAAVCLYGVHDFAAFVTGWEGASAVDSDICRQASPMNYIAPGNPPTLLLHGTCDEAVPYQQSEQYAAALEQAAIPSRLIIIEDAPHSFDLQPEQRDLRADVIDFLNTHLGG